VLCFAEIEASNALDYGEFSSELWFYAILWEFVGTLRQQFRTIELQTSVVSLQELTP
jgi:hypothetical protein